MAHTAQVRRKSGVFGSSLCHGASPRARGQSALPLRRLQRPCRHFNSLLHCCDRLGPLQSRALSTSLRHDSHPQAESCWYDALSQYIVII